MTDAACQPVLDDVTYSYKPSLFGAPWQFRLTPDDLEWVAGSRKGRIAYARIRRLRLSFRPVSTQSYRFLAEIWPSEGGRLRIASTSWRGIVEQERLDAAYSAFVRELHDRIAAVRPEAVFETGMPPLIYWLGFAIFALITLGLAALIARAMQVGQWVAAAMIAGFLALSLWRVGTFLQRNRPRTYSPDRVPAELLPAP
jgi:hypothetical protein